MYFLGGDDAIAKNRTLVEEKVNSVIKSWTFFSKGLSFIGRVLVVRQNCGILYRCCSLHKTHVQTLRKNDNEQNSTNHRTTPN